MRSEGYRIGECLGLNYFIDYCRPGRELGGFWGCGVVKRLVG